MSSENPDDFKRRKEEFYKKNSFLRDPKIAKDFTIFFIQEQVRKHLNRDNFEFTQSQREYVEILVQANMIEFNESCRNKQTEKTEVVTQRILQEILQMIFNDEENIKNKK
jgi:hypothetical protein